MQFFEEILNFENANNVLLGQHGQIDGHFK